MTSLFEHSKDFLILLQGSMLLLIAAQSALLRKLDLRPGWGVLSVFCVLLAIGELLEISQLYLNDGILYIDMVRAFLWVGAVLCLGRWLLLNLGGRGVRMFRIGQGQYQSTIALVVAGLGVSYSGRFMLLVSGDWRDEFLSLYRPGQVLICGTLLVVLGLRHAELSSQRMDPRSLKDLLRWRWIWTLAAAGLLLIGGLGAEYEGNQCDSRMRTEIMNRTLTAAALIPRAQVNALYWGQPDLGRPAYEALKTSMRELVKANPDFRFAMLMGIEPDVVRFLVDSEPPDSSEYSPPGQLYEEAEAEYLDTVRRRQPFVLGPITDRWGKWVSSSVPLAGCESPRGWVTIDFDVRAQDWDRQIGLARLPILSLSFMGLALLAGLVIAFEQVRGSAVLAGSSERRSRTIVEGSRNCVQMVDRDGRFVVVNRNGQEALGRGLEELIGVEFDAIWPPRSRAAVRLLVRQTLSGKPGELDAEYVRPDGRVVVWSLATNPSLDEKGLVSGFVCISVDITERRRVEAELRAAKEAAEAAMRARGEFLAVMSHEIRTPLSGVISLLALLQKQPLDSQERRYTDLARDNAETLLQILDDLLDAAKIEAGKLSMEAIPFQPARTMNPVLEVMRVRAQAKDIALTCELSPLLPRVLLGDPTRLRQVLANLLSNAIKFTSRGSVHVSIDCDPVPPEWVMLHLRVSDTGVGIPREAQQKLFSRFEQADTTTTRRFGGTGLGLSIVKSIAEMMGGSVVMESEEGKGSTFTFSALLAVGSELGPAETEKTVEASLMEQPCEHRLSFLYAEDNETNQFILQSLLMLLGHDLELAPDGSKALEKLREKRYDAVFMDNRMPVMDGLAATRMLRDPASGALDPQVYVVALTANSTEADRDRSLEAGMNDYLTKPVHEGELRRAISRIIAYQRRRGIEMRAQGGEDDGLQEVPGLSAAELLAMAGVEGEEGPGGEGSSQANSTPGLSASTLRSITQQYIEDAPRRLRVMREALGSGDRETLAITAHSLKSVSRYVNAHGVADLCAKLEALADAGQFDAAGPILLLVEQGIAGELPRLMAEAAE